MTTNDSSRAVRWLVIVALSVATAGMFLISMRANYLYGRSIGQSAETQEALAWANVGADVWKAFRPHRRDGVVARADFDARQSRHS